MEINKLLATKIHDIRQHLGLTQSEFGKLLGSSYQSVSAWEKGRNLPDIATILKIINIAGISYNEFFSEISIIHEDEDTKMYVSPEEQRCICKLRTLAPKDRSSFETILLNF